MRFSFILIFINLLTVSASVYSQATKFSLDLKNASVEQIFKEIEHNSDFTFLYKTDLVDTKRKVNIRLNDATVENVLDQLLENTDIGYRVLENNLVILMESDAKVLTQLQQGITVTGVLSDDAGGTIPGANVMIKGTTTGVVTDINGKYTITVPNTGTTLQFSFIGYNTQEEVVGNRKVIDVLMVESSQELEEVVVIGYGTVARKDLTGSVSSVSGERLKDIPVTSASEAITGRMPGVQVTKTEGSPDAEIKIRVRGGGSITQDNSPLFIVDGYQVDNISHIPTTDIASIDVLKDASSTAIYGSRGANGVIILTTKSGSEGKAKISYNAYYGIKEITKYIDMMSPYDYVMTQHELQNASTSLARYFGDPKDYHIWKSFKGTDWQKEIFGDGGSNMSQNLSISGGTKVANYNVSLTYNTDDAIMMGSGYDQTSLSARTSYIAKDWLKFELNTRYSGTNFKGAGTGTGSSRSGESLSRLLSIAQYRPINGFADYVELGADDDPDLYEISSVYATNPLEQTLDDYRREKRNMINIGGALDFTILPGLTYRFQYSTQTETREKKRFWGRRTSDVRDFGRMPMIEFGTEKIVRNQMVNTLTYSKKDFLPGHNLTVLAGEELVSRKSDVVTNNIKYFPEFIDPEGAFSMASLGIADPVSTQNYPATKSSSFFGRVNYDYKGRYLLSGVLRADGSSKFAPGNRWGYFPAASAVWRVSDETFMKSTETWLSNLRLRFSYGQAGNSNIGDDAWKKTFSVPSSKRIFMEGDETTATSYIFPESVLSNEKLKWETTVTRNGGVDFGFFKGRLNGYVEVYQNTTRDLLIKASVPAQTGYTSQWQNIGQTSNRGIELNLEGVIVDSKNFYLAASFNIAFNRNKVDDLGGVNRMLESSGAISTDGPGTDYLVEVGRPVGLMYGFVTEGMYTIDDFEDYYAAGNTWVLKGDVSSNETIINCKRFWPGVLKLKNQKQNDAEAETMTAEKDTPFGKRAWALIDDNDKVVIGRAYPKHTGGFNINGQFKGFDFSVFFNWVYGNNIYNANKLEFTSYRSSRNWKNLMNIMNTDNRFTYYDPTTMQLVSTPEGLKELNQNATMWSPNFSGLKFHSWAVEDGSFLRLNNATLGYSIPKKLLSRFHIQQLRVYVTGHNLWIWTKYSGYDPEVDSRRSNPLTPGVDWSAYPRSRSYNVGLNLTF